jgi:hypothetical protein
LADNVFRIDNGKLIDKVGTDTWKSYLLHQ